MAKKLTNEEFKKRGTIKHKGKYDYSETEYVDNKTPIYKVKVVRNVGMK